MNGALRHTVREREAEREASATREIPSVHCYSRLHLNIVAVVSDRTGGGTGGTNLGAHTYTLYVRTHIQIHLKTHFTDVHLQYVHTPTQTPLPICVHTGHRDTSGLQKPS